MVAGDNGTVNVLGLSAQVTIFGFEATDRIVINLLAGDDTLEASTLQAVMLLTGIGGDGDDVMVGGLGADVFAGGPGDDTLVGGPGVDILDGGDGSNTIIPD